jgi:hypothetical protein
VIGLFGYWAMALVQAASETSSASKDFMPLLRYSFADGQA